MRLIGHVENQVLAERAGSVLGACGIANRVELEDERNWGVWVLGDDDLERGSRVLRAFLASPDDPRFHAVAAVMGSRSAGGSVSSAKREASGSGRAEGEGGVGQRRGGDGVSLLWVVACVWVAAMTQLGRDWPATAWLQISAEGYGLRSVGWGRLPAEVWNGQFWRLLSPVLLHFSWAHLLFNLWAFWDLGRMIERRRGGWALVGMVVVFGVISNLGQYWMSGPRFGGMSGVIYGLLGYVWMMGRYRPSAGLALHPQIVLFMLVWFGVGLYGALPDSPVTKTLGASMANTAHGLGLLAGVAWGRWVAWRGRG